MKISNPGVGLFLDLSLALSNGVISLAKNEEGYEWQPTSHPCERQCVEDQGMTCYYNFTVEWYYSMSKACYDCPRNMADCFRPDCVTTDGLSRVVTVVNKQLPGPSIEVCLGDKVIVDLNNAMDDESTSIHWHGHHQVNSPYMDGVPYITQCPVSPNSAFRYIMDATNSGTHFWHAHTGVQRSDGFFGPFIVREPASMSTFGYVFDLDLSEHTIVVNDWTLELGIEKIHRHLQSSGDNKPDTILVNGRGRLYNDSKQLTGTPLAIFTVHPGLRYRFRLINSGVHNCPVELDIDDHNITVVASDGFELDPVVVDSLVSYAGERWDFVLHADKPPGNYWMRFTGLMDCDERFKKAHQVAILRYVGAPDSEPSAPVGYYVQPPAKLQLNSLNVPFNQTGTISVPWLMSSNHSDDPVLLKDPDKVIFLSFDFNDIDHPLYHKHHLYGFYQVNKTMRRHTPQFNHVSLKTPQSPLLSQYKDIDPSTFCDHHDLSNCNATFCECIYLIHVPLNTNVELILVDQGYTFDANHPFHLHGYAFRVVGMDRLGKNVDVNLVKKMHEEGKLIRNLENPPYKDTVTVPDGGYTILRFHADNPGYWLLHCHIELHLAIGMAVVFKVGDPKDFPPVPKGFPKCGNFLPDPKKCLIAL